MKRRTAQEVCNVWKLGGMTWKELFLKVKDHIKSDNISDQSAQLSYYFFFAIFPLLLFLTALLGLFVQPGTFLNKSINGYLSAVLPHSASSFIGSILTQISKRTSAGKLSLGLLVALWSASSGMSAIINALNVAYNIKKTRPWWKQKLLAICLTVVVSVLILVAMALVNYGGELGVTLAGKFGLGTQFASVWNIVQWPLLLFFMLGAFSIIYYFGPNFHHIHWSLLMPGTVIGVALWLVISFGFRYYVHHFSNYSVTYGSIGAIIILLLWFYVSGIALLVGGEVNSAIEHALGNGGQQQQPA